MEFLINIILYIPMSLLRGWAILELWGWYVKPIYDYNLTLVHAIGLSIIITFLTMSKIDTKEKSKDEKIMSYILMVIFPLIMLFFGWFWQHWM